MPCNGTRGAGAGECVSVFGGLGGQRSELKEAGGKSTMRRLI